MSVCLSVCARTFPPPLEMWFLGSSGNFKRLWFSRKNGGFLQNFYQNFIQNVFFTSKKKFPLSLFFYAFLDVSYHPECSKKFSPQIFFSSKIFLGEARRDTMLPSISSFRFITKQNELCSKLVIPRVTREFSRKNKGNFLNSRSYSGHTSKQTRECFLSSHVN